MTAAPPQLRLTPQRRAVLDVLEAARDHPTASDVYDRVRLHAPGIGAATVYRTLQQLAEDGGYSPGEFHLKARAVESGSSMPMTMDMTIVGTRTGDCK